MIEPVRQIATRLEAAYPPDEAEALAWWLAEETTGLSRTQLQIGCKDTTFFANVQKIIDRLLNFEPIQYIFGHTLWCGLDLKLTPATLIPRPETAELVERIDEQLTNHQSLVTGCRVLDIGTGSGCIAIALKKRHPDWLVTGIDVSAEAVSVARENAARNKVEVNFLQMDVFSDEIEGICSCFDLVVSNPPYICESEKAAMRPNVLNHEPAAALFVPDNDPLVFYRRIASLFASQPDPVTGNPSPVTPLFFEINEAFPAELSAMLGVLGYTDIRIINDIYGKPRIVTARGT